MLKFVYLIIRVTNFEIDIKEIIKRIAVYPWGDFCCVIRRTFSHALRHVTLFTEAIQSCVMFI